MKKHKKSKKRLQERDTKTPKTKKKGPSGTVWMGIFIAAIMILSVVGFMWKGDENPETEYNGFSFSVTPDNIWMLDYNGQNIPFFSHPTQLEDINMSPAASAALSNARIVYSTLDPDDPLSGAIGKAQFDISTVLSSRQVYFIYSFTRENPFNKTIITCENATPSDPVIYFMKGNTTQIDYDNNCIIIEADTEHDMIMLRDRVLYTLYGVMS